MTAAQNHREIEPFSVVELFAGIGGFALAFERRGFHVTDQVEIDPYCLAVISKRFPESRKHTDVKDCGSHNLPRPHVLCGGFPCQPHSLAGKRKGAEDHRDLWPDIARLVRELQPGWVVLENVPAVKTSDGGWYFWKVLSELAACGYDAQWDCLPASAIGANHQRDRIWIVAYPQSVGGGTGIGLADSKSAGFKARHSNSVGNGVEQIGTSPRCRVAQGEDVGDSLISGLEGHAGDGHTGREQEQAGSTSSAGVPGGASADTPSGGRRELREPSGKSGLTDWIRQTIPHPDIFSAERIAVARSECDHWATEPNVGRVAHGIPSQVDRLRAIGNALVPQVAEVIAQRILEIELGI